MRVMTWRAIYARPYRREILLCLVLVHVKNNACYIEERI